MIWKLQTESVVAALQGSRQLQQLGLAMPVRLDSRDMIFDSERRGSAADEREIRDVIHALWDGPAEIVDVRVVA